MKRATSFISFVLIFLLLSLSDSFAQEPAWLQTMKKIKPLRDTRQTVREIYGVPVLIEEDRDFFVIKEGRIVATYSNGECSERDLYGKWQVSKDTLISLDMDIKEQIKFTSDKFKVEGFKLLVPDDTPQMKIYTNSKTGFKYIVQFRGFLSDVAIEPSKSQYKSLHCEK